MKEVTLKILLPPSESKAFGNSGKSLSIPDLSFPEITDARTSILKQLIKVSKSKTALQTLGLTVGLKSELLHNQEIFEAETAPAISIYEGVVYQNIDYASLNTTGKKNFAESALIVSSAFGVLRPHDLIPHYRLSGSTTLPKVGVVSTFWNKRLNSVFENSELLVDCRSGTYEKFWKPSADQNYVRIKVMQYDLNKKQKLAVSHFNKATKGLVTRELVTSRKKFSTPEMIAESIAKAGWEVELTHPAGVATLEVMIR